MQLRGYQLDNERAIYQAWEAGRRNVMSVLPTGAGKTVLFTKIMRDCPKPSIAIAHRQELVSQISLALGRHGVQHSLIAPTTVVKLIVSAHMRELGRSYYNPQARACVAGVDTLIRRSDSLPQFGLWVQDECHHVLKTNKWGKAVDMFPNAKGLGVTATPRRADGKGLGMHSDGVFEEMIVGPTMRDLIDQEFLTEYRIFCPPSDIDLAQVSITATGDYSKPKLKKAIEKSHVIGDVVEHYIKLAYGELGVTFATDVETATNIAESFNASGIPAAVVSAKTNDRDRAKILEKFKKRELWQLVNVDLFGEGFDLPAIEVVSMARPTQSYSLYVQQFGRALRPVKGKAYAKIIDHVGNVLRHGLPDMAQEWSLDAREKRGSNNNQEGVIPVTVCVRCTAVFGRLLKSCPFCGHYEPPAARNGIEFVDGDLMELDPATLMAMRGNLEATNMSNDEYRAGLAERHIPVIGQMSMVKKHHEKREAQTQLRDTIAWWAGHERARGCPDSESYKKFYFLFGIDVLTAQSLKPKEALILQEKVQRSIDAPVIT